MTEKKEIPAHLIVSGERYLRQIEIYERLRDELVDSMKRFWFIFEGLNASGGAASSAANCCVYAALKIYQSEQKESADRVKLRREEDKLDYDEGWRRSANSGMEACEQRIDALESLHELVKMYLNVERKDLSWFKDNLEKKEQRERREP